MNWADLGGKLIRAGAPLIGTAVGGPLGGAIGGALGNILAGQLDTEPTPEAIEKKINQLQAEDPELLKAKLASAEAEAQAKWTAIMEMAKAEADIQKTNVVEVNETIRSEVGQISWWHWRHLLGYAVLLWIVCPLPPIMWFMMRGNIEVMNAAIAGVVSLIPLIAIAAGLNGFVARDNTLRTTAAMTGEKKPTIIEQVTKALPVRRK